MTPQTDMIECEAAAGEGPGALNRLVQLGAHPQDAQGNASHGRWPDRQAHEHGRRGGDDRCSGRPLDIDD